MHRNAMERTRSGLAAIVVDDADGERGGGYGLKVVDAEGGGGGGGLD